MMIKGALHLAAALDAAKDNQYSLAVIARQLHCSPQALRNEIIDLNRALSLLQDSEQNTAADDTQGSTATPGTALQRLLDKLDKGGIT